MATFLKRTVKNGIFGRIGRFFGRRKANNMILQGALARGDAPPRGEVGITVIDADDRMDRTSYDSRHLPRETNIYDEVEGEHGQRRINAPQDRVARGYNEARRYEARALVNCIVGYGCSIVTDDATVISGDVPVEAIDQFIEDSTRCQNSTASSSGTKAAGALTLSLNTTAATEGKAPALLLNITWTDAVTPASVDFSVAYILETGTAVTLIFTASIGQVAAGVRSAAVERLEKANGLVGNDAVEDRQLTCILPR
jgi:hypothetical protein